MLVVPASDKSQQWLLKLVDEFMMRNRIFTYYQSITPQSLITKGPTLKLRTSLNQVMKINLQ